MNRNTDKRRKHNEACQAERDAYLMGNQLCQVCRDAWSTEIHELCRGPARKVAIGERCTWLACCRTCHDKMGDYGEFPLALAYGFKALRDSEHYDRVKCNRIRGRADDAISEVDVVKAIWRATR